MLGQMNVGRLTLRTYEGQDEYKYKTYCHDDELEDKMYI